MPIELYIELGWFLFIEIVNDNCIAKQFKKSCILILEYH
jgi:hypothetical protein